ncbi:carboxymuconolactone decarboxylase family protein [Marilutibacter aestuarii]|uniref:Carboxymuconolactone decarboxylase family protein n=1 Tax=Marilutibacter aestuarii TaxID=1706195 RepID=A0A507ZSA0_9GAMM|nr:carboxymuconolactone decarboxylase family protein [Lysobacter aestuarii]TQD39877.1 carboxymuconolactone decarboxylase family protein [Lysobacter aestuarii]
MQQRMNWHRASPDATEAMMALEIAVSRLGLEPGLLGLLKLRVSQVNGCGYCIEQFGRDARARGEPEARLQALVTWRGSELYSARERAALAWAEALTRLADTGAPDEDYLALAAHFDEKARVDLTLAIASINAWNRFGVGFRVALPD